MSITYDFYYGKECDQFTFIKIPKLLFTEKILCAISNDAKILYALLLDRMSLSQQNAWFDSANRVYIIFTIEEAKEILSISNDKACKLFSELTKFGLIERKRQGLGKPSLIYVKNFVTGQANNSNKKSEIQNSEKQNSVNPKSRNQEVLNSDCNKTEFNKTKFNDTDNQFEIFNINQIKQNINFDMLSKRYGFKIIDSLTKLIKSKATSNNSIIKINKNLSMPKEEFLKKIMCFNSNNFIEVLEKISKLEKQPHDLTQYIFTCLFQDIPQNNVITNHNITPPATHSYNLDLLMQHARDNTPTLATT